MNETAATNKISLVEILASLSHALDLTSGQPMGHSQRTCLIALRIGSLVGLSEREMNSLHLATLMKDAGCSSNAARMVEIFGSDDLHAKRMSKVTDWTNLADAAKYVCNHAFPESPLLLRAVRILKIITHKSECSEQVAQSRCDRGSQIALNIGLGQDAALCIQHLDEHWDGNGIPRQVKGDKISLLGRIVCLSQTLEVFSKTFDLSTAYQMLRKRSGSWFDPSLVKVALSFEKDAAFWNSVENSALEALLAINFVGAPVSVNEARIDAICMAFAQIVDAKSTFTAQHSFRVSGYAVEIAEKMGLEAGRIAEIRRAGLLHDLGKLGVSNTILDKKASLTPAEWEVIRKHPLYTHEILKHIKGFSRINQIASAHHERLDGKGYYLGMKGSEIDLDMRILAVADVFDSLSATRPYRAAINLEDVFKILKREEGVALDSTCIPTLREIFTGSRSTKLMKISTIPVRTFQHDLAA